MKADRGTARSLVPPSRGSPPVTIAGLPIPETFLYRGADRSGMQGDAGTLTILRLLLLVLHALAFPNSRRKLVIVDVKGDLTSNVLGLIRVIAPAFQSIY